VDYYIVSKVYKKNEISIVNKLYYKDNEAKEEFLSDKEAIKSILAFKHSVSIEEFNLDDFVKNLIDTEDCLSFEEYDGNIFRLELQKVSILF
jgi:hypothetical protein